MLKTLFIVRHGESEWNHARRIQGHLDSPLSRHGRQQAKLLGKLLPGKLDAVYSSDLTRAIQTAELSTGLSRDRIVLTPDLREIGFGKWEGMSPDEVREKYPEDWELFRKDPINGRPAYTESTSSLSQRVQRFLEGLHRDFPGRKAACYTHGGVVRMMLINILGLPPACWRTLRVANTGLTRVDFHDDAQPLLVYYNVTTHLVDFDAPEEIEKEETDA